MQTPERFKIGETLQKDIGPKLNILVEFVKSLVPHGDQSTIKVNHTDNGCFFSSLTRGGGGSRGSDSSYVGPFAVVASDNTTVKIYSYNGDEDRSFTALIIAGLQMIEFEESEITVSGAGYVWIEITQSENVYSYECKFGSRLPAQTDSLLVIPLADVAFEDGAITEIIQMQYGNIHIAGRIV